MHDAGLYGPLDEKEEEEEKEDDGEVSYGCNGFFVFCFFS